jgi:hypothetical protein
VSETQGTDPMAAPVGPFYDTTGVSRMTGLSATEIAGLRDKGALLARTTSDDVWAYPAFGRGRSWATR